MLIEFIAVTVEDAKFIEKSGADRIELVSGLTEGGITPSYGLIENVVNSVSIPVNVMVRPHSQSFCYSEDDIAIMKNDIRVIRSLGANGVVLGMLDGDGNVDFQQLEELLTEIGTMEVTFHRAIDSSNNIVQNAEKLNQYQEIKTILTSGGHGDWPTRLDTLRKLKEICKETDILIGSGLSKDNIREVHKQVGTNCYHFGTAVRIDHSILKSVSLEKAVEIVHTLK
ncbi:copper homeostasis protein CutC [Bacillus sp. EB106-08-02-XG196]|jgi:copper homeostasis protein|uniref:copper homeostasis protein CutC n=1 Tax=Bacillus sp. EB106-08-02-XG196 TaxID=2737049 RepID=UPI0015C4D05E|nr:copper homeostasis protein CutC [Bacillus sp. EB106-08-02-XG196]NWQ39514.1 copper homeostasis protein CutC [Bacillus sp. EB106-08-02-XG196]